MLTVIVSSKHDEHDEDAGMIVKLSYDPKSQQIHMYIKHSSDTYTY